MKQREMGQAETWTEGGLKVRRGIKGGRWDGW